MIINLKKSILFKTDPKIRFAKEYGDYWGEIWRRYKILDYSVQDLCDFYHIKTGNRINTQTVRRWIWRTEVYKKAEPIMDEGVEIVRSEYFGEYEEELLKELLKNFSEHPETKILP